MEIETEIGLSDAATLSEGERLSVAAFETDGYDEEPVEFATTSHHSFLRECMPGDFAAFASVSGEPRA